ncbi:glutathionylspermidine synthase family protein [Agromyces seonyuensis]|uniref:Glutathionylspermidine synthase family protein n=1 Tax=Agromyces seonyuensis TaxID=2662446 RepID=A0A6I4NYB4_9MICO|nr:glutathionylspermidine synthase family protein [Agromyces seonyuensis]MWB98162.1 glutathionylspermidine synthase family protein [Agromyces seonyuensis]
MIRVAQAPRPDWRAGFDRIGFTFHDLPSEGGRPYWQEEAAYGFASAEIDAIEAATAELFARCMDAVEHVVRHRRFAEFAIPTPLHDLVERSWDEDDPTLYGRFDLALDGPARPDGSVEVRDIRMLEFNADTPTSLVESSAAQWQWLRESRGAESDQFNLLHELLVEQWAHVRAERFGVAPGARLHLASLHDGGDGRLIVEDFDTVAYLAETAREAGFDPKQIFVEQLAFDADARAFVDADGERVERIFKLYPWEWMAIEQFAALLPETRGATAWIEPAWKLLLSNKQLLVVLHELFPGHPNLLPAFRSPAPLADVDRVMKPLLGREGGNVTLIRADGTIEAEQPGDYGAEGFVFQQRAGFARFDGRTPVVGSWVVGETPAGIGIRETSGPITGDLAEFVPHFITDPRPAGRPADPDHAEESA